MDLRGDAIVLVGPVEPLLVEGRRAPQPQQRLVDGEQPPAAPHRVVELERLPRLARLGVPRRIAGPLEGRHRDVVHLQVVRVRVALLVVVVGDDHLRPGPADDRHEPADGLVERGLVEAGRVLVGRGVGHARVPVAEHDHLVEADDLGRAGELLGPQVRRAGPSPARAPGRGRAARARGGRGSGARPPRRRCSTRARCGRPRRGSGPAWARPSRPRRRDGRAR